MMHHDCKRYMEEYIIESELPYIILQPTTFMDIIPAAMLEEQEQPALASPWNVDVKFSFMALEDLAAAMFTVLSQQELHFSAAYPLVSTHKALSWCEAMDILSSKMGKHIDLTTSEYKVAVDTFLGRLYGTSEGIDPRSRDEAQRVILCYDYRGLVGNSNVLEWLLERGAMQFDTWAESKVQEVRQKTLK